MTYFKLIIRALLTALCTYGVYTETGPWTAASLALIYIGIELLTQEHKAINARQDLTNLALRSLYEGKDTTPGYKIDA